MVDSNDSTMAALRAMSNPKRMTILRWLRDPTAHFPPQRDGDLVDDGVCVGFITQKIGLSQPSVTEHMQVLAAAQLVTSKKCGNWMFYKLDETKVASFLSALQDSIGQPETTETVNSTQDALI